MAKGLSVTWRLKSDSDAAAGSGQCPPAVRSPPSAGAATEASGGGDGSRGSGATEKWCSADEASAGSGTGTAGREAVGGAVIGAIKAAAGAVGGDAAASGPGRGDGWGGAAAEGGAGIPPAAVHHRLRRSCASREGDTRPGDGAEEPPGQAAAAAD